MVAGYLGTLGLMFEPFVRICRKAFEPLVTQFGFREPEIAKLGRECFVRYHKGAATVSIAFEPGTTPIVELFFPAGPGDSVVPWAERGGVAYARRLPLLRPSAKCSPAEPELFAEYLAQSMAELAQAESKFLRASHSQTHAA